MTRDNMSDVKHVKGTINTKCQYVLNVNNDKGTGTVITKLHYNFL